MIRNIIKYLGIALVIVGVLLVMKNLFSKDSDLSTDNNYYSAKIKLLDKDTANYIKGAKLSLKDETGKTIKTWTTEDKAYTINKLEKGKYTLIEEEAPKYYHLNEEKIEFEIKNKDKTIIMYNKAMTEEEIKKENTTETNVNVDNTASNKNILTIIVAFIISILGLGIIYKTKKNY